MAIFNVICSESAGRVRDALPDDRRELLQRGLAVVAAGSPHQDLVADLR